MAKILAGRCNQLIFIRHIHLGEKLQNVALRSENVSNNRISVSRTNVPDQSINTN